MNEKREPFYRDPSKAVCWLIILTVIGFTFFKSLWTQPDKIFHDDINHYYSYLPATFIHHDLSLNFIFDDVVRHAKHFWPLKSPGGNWVIVTTMGLSLMYLPFFLIIHYPLTWMGVHSDGFTAPYQLALILSSVFYFAVGLLFLRRILARYFSRTTTAITLFAVVMATNLFYYVTDEPAMSHVYNFALITLFLYQTIRWHEKPALISSVCLGLIAGLIALIRPTNILVVIVFLFWNVDSFSSLKIKVSLLVSKYRMLLIMIAAAILVWLPQMIYWKYVTGQFLYFSYGDKGKFFFSNPQVINTLFSYRKGWLLYTPVMIFSFVGLYFLWKKYRNLFWPVVTFTLVNIWVISSWWLWWYGGSYGLRAYIDSYSIAALPFAAFVAWAFEKRHLLVKSGILLLLSLFTAHNFFQIEQYHTGAIDYVSMTKEAYWASFGHIKQVPGFPNLLSYPDYKSAEKGIYPKPVLDPLYTGKLTRSQGIKRIEKDLRASPEQAESIRQKAADRSIPVDSMFYIDAQYIYDLKVSNGSIKPADEPEK